MSTGTDSKQITPRWLRLPFGLLVAFLTYILSVGPVLTVAERFGLGSTRFYQPLRGLYAPVFAIARSSNSGTRFYASYVGFWCRIVFKRDDPKYSPGAPVEGLLVSIGTITNGQSSFELLVRNKLSFQGGPTRQDVAMALIIDKAREQGLYPAGFREQSGGRVYTFQKVREWEIKSR